MTDPLRTHPFHHSGHTDWRGVAICDCGSARDATVHKLPERDEEEKAVEARRVGEAE